MPLTDTRNPVIYTNWNLIQQYGNTGQGATLTLYTNTQTANTFANTPDVWFSTYRGGGVDGKHGATSARDNRVNFDVSGKRNILYGGYFPGPNPASNVPNYYSILVSGAQNPLIQVTPANAVLAAGTGDFTIESWVQWHSLPSTGNFSPICQNNSQNISIGTTHFVFGLLNQSGDYSLQLRQHTGSTVNIGAFVRTVSWTPTLYQWYHVAITRQSGITRIFIDGNISLLWGNQITSPTSNNVLSGISFGQNGFMLSSSAAAGGGLNQNVYYFNGILYGFRYTVGSALYTNSFSRPTGPYTAEVGTQILTCQPINGTGFGGNARLTDLSNNSFSISTSGSNVSISNPFASDFSGYYPINQNVAAVLANNGGSAIYEIDGGLNTARAIVSYDKFLSAGNGLSSGYGMHPHSVNPKSDFFVQGTRINDDTTRPFLNQLPSQLLNSPVTRPTSTTVLPLYTDVRTANTFINDPDTWFRKYRGGENGNAGPSSSFDNRLNFDIDGKRSVVHGGYVVSNTASSGGISPVHNGAAILANTGGSALYVEDRGIIRIQSYPNYINIPSSGLAVNNTGSVLFSSGGSSFLSVGGTWTLPTTTTPFTIECWIRPTSSFTGTAIASTAFAGSGALPFILGLNNGTTYSAGSAGSNPYLNYFDGSSWGAAVVSNTAVSLDTWTHIAGVFNGTTANIYVNGVSTGSWTTSWISTGQANFYIGRRWDLSGSNYYNGYISNFRFVIGSALYTGSSFTVPDKRLTAVSNTILLTCTNNDAYRDFSSNANTVSTSGSVSLSTLTPFSNLAASGSVNNSISTVTAIDNTIINANTPYVLNNYYTPTAPNGRVLVWPFPYSSNSSPATPYYYNPISIFVDRIDNEIKTPRYGFVKINVVNSSNTFINDPDTWFRTHRRSSSGSLTIFSVDDNGQRNIVFGGSVGNAVSYRTNTSPLNTSGEIYGGISGKTSLTVNVYDINKFGPKSFSYEIMAVDIGHTGVGIPDGAGTVGTTITESWS